ncbi:MAG: ATP-binding protein [Thermomicrobiales bacterium]
MIPALQSLADQFEPSFAVRLDVDERFRQMEEANREAVAEPVKLAAYRIAEDALTNILKHAGATMARIRLDIEHGEQLRLTIEDNGKGFEVEGSGRGLGLEAMQDYASAVGGACTIWSAPGRGTTVTVRLPLEHE